MDMTLDALYNPTGDKHQLDRYFEHKRFESREIRRQQEIEREYIQSLSGLQEEFPAGAEK